MAKILRMLRRENASMTKVLDAFDRQIASVKNTEIPDFEMLEAIIDYCLGAPQQCHHPKEVLVYDKLRERDAGAAGAVGDLAAWHEELAGLARRFAESFDHMLEDVERSRERFIGSARNFVEFCRRQMEMEEKVLYPAARRRLTREDWLDIETRLAEVQAFAGSVQARFERLLADIVTLDRPNGQSPAR